MSSPSDSGELKEQFEAANGSAKRLKRRKRPPPLSIRISDEERAQLKKDAKGGSLNAYVRERLFKSRAKPKLPVKQQQALVRALSRLGKSGITRFLENLKRAHEDGRITLSDFGLGQLESILTDCEAVRHDLIVALGVDPADDA